MLPSIPKLADYESAVRGAAAAAGGASLAFGASLGTNTAGGSAGTTVVLTTSGAVPSGARIVVGVGWHANSLNTTSSLAGGGLTWTQDITAAPAVDTNYRCAIFSAAAPAGLASSTALTVTYSGASWCRSVAGCYFTGVATSSWEDDDGSAAGEAFSITWGAPLTTLTANTALVGFGWIDHNDLGTGTPTTNYINAVPMFANVPDVNSIAMVYRIVSSTGTYTPGGAFTDDVPAGNQMTVSAAVAYKKAP